MISQPLKIIIVGAGIGGLCAALALRQAGHLVEVIKVYLAEVLRANTRM